MKARSILTEIIAAAVLASSLLSPAVADTGISGYVYLQEDEPRPVMVEQASQGVSTQALAEEVLRLTNQERARNGLAPLQRHQALENAASDHSQEMRQLDYFSHNSPTAGSTTPRHRVNRYGLNPQMVAENIYECSGYDVASTARYAVEAFMQSPGHRQNILSPTATHIGVGLVETNGTVSVTQVFGAGI